MLVIGPFINVLAWALFSFSMCMDTPCSFMTLCCTRVSQLVLNVHIHIEIQLSGPPLAQVLVFFTELIGIVHCHSGKA